MRLQPSLDRRPARPDLVLRYDGTTRPASRLHPHDGRAADHFRRYNEAYGPLRFDNHLGPHDRDRAAAGVADHSVPGVHGRPGSGRDRGRTHRRPHRVARARRTVRASPTPRSRCSTSRSSSPTDHLSITDADRDALRAHFTPTQIVEVGLLAAMCLVGRFSQIAGLEEPM